MQIFGSKKRRYIYGSAIVCCFRWDQCIVWHAARSIHSSIVCPFAQRRRIFNKLISQWRSRSMMNAKSFSAYSGFIESCLINSPFGLCPWPCSMPCRGRCTFCKTCNRCTPFIMWFSHPPAIIKMCYAGSELDTHTHTAVHHPAFDWNQTGYKLELSGSRSHEQTSHAIIFFLLFVR